MHDGVLSVGTVQPLAGVLVCLVLTQHFLQQLELEVLVAGVGGSLEEYGSVDVVHLVIPHVHCTSSEFTLLSVHVGQSAGVVQLA